MGKIKPYPPVKLFAAVTINDLRLWPEIKGRLETAHSPIDSSLDWFDFTFTDYYQVEMGVALQKGFVSFQELIDAAQLPDIKIATNRLEDEFTAEGSRRVNIDPGYLDLAKIVLATTKDFSHRLYLEKGILGDLHLKYQKDGYQPQPWTYADYQQPKVLEFFKKLRKIYQHQRANFN